MPSVVLEMYHFVCGGGERKWTLKMLALQISCLRFEVLRVKLA